MVLGLHSRDRKSSRDKANISNPKVNRGCPPLTANRTSADCANFTWTLNAIYSTEGVPHWMFQNYETLSHKKLFIHTQHFTRLHALRRCVRNHVSVVLNSTCDKIIDKINTHSFEGLAAHVKHYIISSNSPECSIGN